MKWTVLYPLERQNVMLRFRSAGFSVDLHPESARAISDGSSEIAYLKAIVEHTSEYAMTLWLLANPEVNLRIVDD